MEKIILQTKKKNSHAAVICFSCAYDLSNVLFDVASMSFRVSFPYIIVLTKPLLRYKQYSYVCLRSLDFILYSK